jgi:glutamate synthase (NADPH/NADH) small chain
MILRSSTSHEEGCQREWGILTTQFCGDANGNVESLVTVRIEWGKDEQGRNVYKEVDGTQQVWPCQLVLLAMGFVGPEKAGPISDLGLEMDGRGNVKTDGNYMTSRSGVFAAGDLRRGQSLVVWAIHEGREAARAVDKFLMGVSHLPSVNAGDFAWK